MERIEILIVGDSLFAETLTQLLLDRVEGVKIQHTSSLETALPLLATHHPDMVLVTGQEPPAGDMYLSKLLADISDFLLILVSLSSNRLQVITCRCMDASPSNLMALMAELPQWS